jgi:hypothetical protein
VEYTEWTGKDTGKGVVEAAICSALDLVGNPKVPHRMSSYVLYFHMRSVSYAAELSVAESCDLHWEMRRVAGLMHAGRRFSSV